MKELYDIRYAMDIYDKSRVWYHIPGYNGYELSSDYYIRSMKMFKKYPFGILITPKKSKDGQIVHPENPIFELSDDNNIRKTITMSEIVELVNNDPNKNARCPIYTYQQDAYSRNPRQFIDKSKRYAPIDNTKTYSVFGKYYDKIK